MNRLLIAAVAFALAAPITGGVAAAQPDPALAGEPTPIVTAPTNAPSAEPRATELQSTGASLAAETSAPQSDAMPATASIGAIPDPWEDFNRRMYRFNDAIDRAVLEPLAKGYRTVTPRFARTGVANVLENLTTPVTAANALLQGTPGRAGAAVGRFGVNSTIGVAGLFDVATAMGIPKHNEDFGQTLAVWGVRSGPYLMLPFSGPSTLRDFPGGIVDNAFKPLTYADDATELRVGLAALRVLSAREGAIETIDDLRANAPDPYVTIRSVYGQSRASAIRNGRQNVEDLPDFGDPP